MRIYTEFLERDFEFPSSKTKWLLIIEAVSISQYHKEDI